MASAGAMNGFFQHWHLYDERVWQMLLESKGFAVDKVIYMGQRRSEFLFRLGLPSAFLAFLFKRMFGVYPNRFAPLFMRRLATRIVARVLSSAQGVGTDNEERDSAYEYAFLCQRIAR